jgi:hypothetical protein
MGTEPLSSRMICRWLFFVDATLLAVAIYFPYSPFDILISGTPNGIVVYAFAFTSILVSLLVLGFRSFSSDVVFFRTFYFGLTSLLIGMFLLFVTQGQKELWQLGSVFAEAFLFVIAICTGVISLLKDKQNNLQRSMAAIGILLAMLWLSYGYKPW